MSRWNVVRTTPAIRRAFIRIESFILQESEWKPSLRISFYTSIYHSNCEKNLTAYICVKTKHWQSIQTWKHSHCKTSVLILKDYCKWFYTCVKMKFVSNLFVKQKKSSLMWTTIVNGLIKIFSSNYEKKLTHACLKNCLTKNPILFTWIFLWT